MNDPRRWVQIVNDLRSRIDAGELKRYDRISVAYESQARGVSKETVAKALRALVAEGRLVRFPGHGYLVVGQPGHAAERDNS